MCVCDQKDPWKERSITHRDSWLKELVNLEVNSWTEFGTSYTRPWKMVQQSPALECLSATSMYSVPPMASQEPKILGFGLRVQASAGTFPEWWAKHISSHILPPKSFKEQKIFWQLAKKLKEPRYFATSSSVSSVPSGRGASTRRSDQCGWCEILCGTPQMGVWVRSRFFLQLDQWWTNDDKCRMPLCALEFLLPSSIWRNWSCVPPALHVNVGP